MEKKNKLERLREKNKETDGIDQHHDQATTAETPNTDWLVVVNSSVATSREPRPLPVFGPTDLSLTDAVEDKDQSLRHGFQFREGWFPSGTDPAASFLLWAESRLLDLKNIFFFSLPQH